MFLVAARNVFLTRAAASFLLVALVCSSRGHAASGDLDTDLGGFGADGRILSAGIGITAIAIDAQGRLVLAGGLNGRFHVQRRSGPRFLTVENASTIIDGNELSSVARAVAIAPDGKIVLAGTVVRENGSGDFAVARFNDNLTLDETFAGDGTQNSDFDDDYDEAFSVAVQADLKVVVAGMAVVGFDVFADPHWAVERFNEDGTLDDTFGDGGKWTYDSSLNSFQEEARAVAIQGDGKILVAGTVEAGETTDDDKYDFGVHRLNANGSFDDSFDNDGTVFVDFGESSEGANAVAIDSLNGTIVLAGGESFAGAPQVRVARLLSDGALDNSFDTDGRVIVDANAIAYAAVVQPDHKIVVSGRVGGQFILLRFNADGSLDPTFGDAGQVLTQFGSADTGALALALQPNGSLVAAGGGQVARYRADGSLDAGGVVDIVFDPTQVGSEATALAVDADGKLVAAGKAFLADYDMTLVRYQPSYADGLDPSFGNLLPQSGRTLYGIGGTLETRGMAIRSDGKIVVGGHNFFNDFNFLVARFKADGTPDETCLGIGLNTIDYGLGDDSVASVIVVADKTYAAGTVRGPADADFGLVRLNDVCVIDDAGGAVANEYKFRFDLGSTENLGAMVLQPGTGFVLAGTSANEPVVVRTRQNDLTGNVTLDPNFGTAGRTTLDLGDGETVTGLGLQSDGKLIVSGSVNQAGGSNFFVARLTVGGLLDEDFGIGGLAFASFNAVDTAQALAIRDDDTIAVAGCTTTGNGQVFALAQFTPEGALDTEFSNDGKTTVRTGPSGEECAQAATFVGSDRLVLGGYSSIFGVRNFILTAFESAAAITTTTTIGSTTTTLPSSDCGDPNNDEAITASDALAVLRTAIGLGTCALCVCDADGSGSVAASDALRVLRAAVGQVVTLQCPAC